MSEFSYFQTRGWIEVIVGSMFSGKTEELIRRTRRAEFAKLKVQVFKPVIDNRYKEKEVTSHNLNTVDAIPLNHIEEIWDHLSPKTRVVGIDEGQFFDPSIVQVVQDLADRGLRVIIAGLDTDWKGRPFEPMPTLMAIAENVTKQHAVCMVCGAPASRTQKTSGGDSQIEVGAAESYEARCREHFVAKVDQRTV
ncbi:MAG: thymidine kinase [Bdellovibrionaceae bacterium]|nr:thymidine kinase [Pseudobdellovibrionaceae bacterium]